MDTRRSRQQSQAVAVFRWLGWAILMMFVLVQAVQATSGDSRQLVAASPPMSHGAPVQASARFDPDTHQVTVEAEAPPELWHVTPNIGAHGFVVYEDNVRQRLDAVRAIDQPLSVGVLLEHGGRYHAFNEALAAEGSRAVQELRAALNPSDTMTVWTYGSTVEPLQASAESPGGMQLAGVNLSVAPSSESEFHDAVLNVLPQVQRMPGRKVLVVVSSGIDTFSQADFPQVVRAAETAGVPICPVDIGPLLQATLSSVSGSGDAVYGHLNWRLASERLARLARVSGCHDFRPTSSLDLPAVYDGLLANLRLKYVIQYRSAAPGFPGTRHVRVEWADGLRANAEVAQTNIHESGVRKLLADVRYTVDPATNRAEATAFNWSFLESLSGSEIQIPLKGPGGLSGPANALLADTPEESRRQRRGSGCDGADCTLSIN